MKKLFSFIVASFLLGGVAFAASPEAIGSIKGNDVPKKQGEPVRVFKQVRFGAASPNTGSISSGDAVIYDTTSADGITVTTTTTSGDARFAGIVVTTIQTSDNNAGTSAFDDAGRRNWGYIIVHGPAVAEATNGGGATVGAPFITSTDSTKVARLEGTVFSLDTAANSSAAARRLGEAAAGSGGFFMASATAGTDSYRVFVKAE